MENRNGSRRGIVTDYKQQEQEYYVSTNVSMCKISLSPLFSFCFSMLKIYNGIHGGKDKSNKNNDDPVQMEMASERVREKIKWFE